MKDSYIKLFIGVLLFATWLGLILFNVHGAEDIITAIKAALFGLGVYHLGGREGIGVAAPADKQGGSARIRLLAMIAGASLFLAACAPLAGSQASPTQSAQAQYTQACIAYGGAFAVALDLRQAGKLSQSQIDQITVIDSQLTPLCTGPMPTDPTAAAQQITAAVTTLTILESTQKAN